MNLRAEIMRVALDDGGLELVDLLLQQVHRLTPAEAAELEAGSPGPALRARLERALCHEGPHAEALRRADWAARTRQPPRPPPPWPEARGPWPLAEALPAWVDGAWRRPERWRRVAEDRIAGRALLRLEGFVETAAAKRLRDAVAGFPFMREEGMYARGGCCQLRADDVPDVLPAFLEGPLHTLLEHVLGDTLPARAFLRAWRLEEGDHIAVHADGLHYLATFSVGLCEGWTAAAGGAIAFGLPAPAGLDVTERWLPHLGDLVLFRPTALLWHGVEPVIRGTRHTLTGHFVGERYGPP